MSFRSLPPKLAIVAVVLKDIAVYVCVETAFEYKLKGKKMFMRFGVYYYDVYGSRLLNVLSVAPLGPAGGARAELFCVGLRSSPSRG